MFRRPSPRDPAEGYETMFHDLRDYESRVHSQSGEDGVLARIFELIGVRTRYFVEFGAWDGVHLSNTANLRLNHGWQGLLMEGSGKADGRIVRREFVSAENVNALFARYAVPEVFDLLSIDIDGNDYWVWKALEDFTPRVVVLEYNIFFRLDEAKTMRYDAKHVWDETRYHGASIAALQKLGEQKGYALVHADSWAPNAFFVKKSDLPEGYVQRPLEEITLWNACISPREFKGWDWVSV